MQHFDMEGKVAMGYGQYVNEHEHGVTPTRPSRRASQYPERPVSRRYTKSEVLSGVNPDTYQDARKTAHNEVTRVFVMTGARVVRLIATDILHVRRIGQGMFDVTINTGGWNTPTTRRHIMDALHRETGVGACVYGSKHGAWRNELRTQEDADVPRRFNNACRFELHGGRVLHFQPID